MDARGQRVSSTHAGKGRWSSILEISSGRGVEVRLNSEKIYILGVNHVIFSLDTAIHITFKIEIIICVKKLFLKGLYHHIS